MQQIYTYTTLSLQFWNENLILRCENLLQVESGKLILEETEFELGRELEGLTDMFSVQRINHNVETVLDLSGMILTVRLPSVLTASPC